MMILKKGRDRVPFSKYFPPDMALGRFTPLVQIVLMVVLGRVEGHGLPNLRGRMIAHLHQFAKDLDGRVALRGVVEPNGGKVLCANVDALAVDLLEVVDFKEIAHQGFVSNLLGVVFHFDGLQVPRRTGLNLFVTRVFHVAAHESDDGLRHALETLEVILHAPEASC